MHINFAWRHVSFRLLGAFLLFVALTGCSTKSNDDSWLLVGTWVGVLHPTPNYAAPVTANFSADGA